MKSKLTLAGFTLVAVILAIIIFAPVTTAQKDNPDYKIGKNDQVVTPQIKDISSSITLTGNISASQIANLQFKTSGRLTWVGVKVGDQVKRGQAVATLDRFELQKSLQTQFNNYRTELSQFNDVQDQYEETKQRLLVTDTIQRILDRTQYSLDNSVINYEIADMAIKDSVLTSPISGVVVQVEQPIAGVNITPATANFVIIDPNSIYFTTEVDQEDVPKFTLKMPATIKLDSYSDKEFDSQVSYIAFTPVSGQSSTVYEVRFTLPGATNSNLQYRLGMDGDATVELQKANNAITIPISALYSEDDKYFVYVKKDSKTATKVFVTTGIENDDEVQILEGVNSHDNLIIKK